ncbi:GlxA family transcriptional regulator [Motilibacter aurantiacus]|uniref:GlxA family transcriptional regulator n=1 Tax=Motilibacter aurantiacus TaxID=2714955 RepID=UPI0014081DAA|nr:helix-turn-helix domain-containing protein [Motilibacter aurantiacus]NHC46729.1 helix-turn-helix domain-containing protein [Motilibacter aurantiacus]
MVNIPTDPASRAQGPHPHRVVVVVQSGMVALDLAIPLQVFGRWPAYLYEALGATDSPYALSIACADPAGLGEDLLVPRTTASLDAVAGADTVIVPGVHDPDASVDHDVADALRTAHANGARLLSICTGAFALAAAGVLDGRRATTHWYWARELQRRHPAVRVIESELYVEDTGVLTSAGVLAGADLCLHVLRSDLGQAAANRMARFLVSPPHRAGGQAQYIEAVPPPDRDDEVGGLMTWILDHLDEPLDLATISRQSHMSDRTLRRRFRATTGSSVTAWVTCQRVARARELLEGTQLSVEQIAHRCGFGSSEALRRNFVAATKVSPAQYRRTFAARGAG